MILFIIYNKMSETTYYQRNRDVILSRAKDYYKNDKKRLTDQAREKYRNLEDKEINREYGNRYNMSEEKKQKLKEYYKNYHEAKKSQSNNQ